MGIRLSTDLTNPCKQHRVGEGCTSFVLSEPIRLGE